tara:strand:+ start:35939 stop:37039 length:1101 start_codon:yes stop_codon:yes gene_type:complete
MAFLLLWWLWPSPINPVGWDEPTPPELTGRLAPNAALSDATIYQTGIFGSARGIAVSPDGQVYFGTPDGNVFLLNLVDETVQGEPVLVAHIADDSVYGLGWIEDAVLGVTCASGVYSLDLNSLEVRTISTGEMTRGFGIVTAMTIGPDGIIYFTDASTRWAHDPRRAAYYFDMLENRPNGVIYSWNPVTRQTQILQDRLYYPYGIVMAADGQSLFFSEPFRYTIQRLWLAGPQAGHLDIVAENLPGMPAGLTLDQHGNLAVAMLSQRSRLLTFVHRNPGPTGLLIKLPQWLRPSDAKPQGYILRLDPGTGEILDTFQSPDSELSYISNITTDADGALWFGSAFGSFVARYLPPSPPADAGRETTSN